MCNLPLIINCRQGIPVPSYWPEIAKKVATRSTQKPDVWLQLEHVFGYNVSCVMLSRFEEFEVCCCINTWFVLTRFFSNESRRFRARRTSRRTCSSRRARRCSTTPARWASSTTPSTTRSKLAIDALASFVIIVVTIHIIRSSSFSSKASDVLQALLHRARGRSNVQLTSSCVVVLL